MADQDEGMKRKGAFSLSLHSPLCVPHFPTPLLSSQCVSCEVIWKGCCFSIGDDTGIGEDDNNVVKILFFHCSAKLHWHVCFAIIYKGNS